MKRVTKHRKLVVQREVIVQLERLELTKVAAGKDKPEDESSSPPRCPPIIGIGQ